MCNLLSEVPCLASSQYLIPVESGPLILFIIPTVGIMSWGRQSSYQANGTCEGNDIGEIYPGVYLSECAKNSPIRRAIATKFDLG